MKKKDNPLEFAIHQHEQVPANWYYQSLKIDPFQKYWHKRRFEEVTKLLEKVDGEVLDVGSADGMFSKVILDGTGAKKLIGIEVLKKSVDWANSHWKNFNMKFYVGDAHDLKFETGKFDAVFCNEVLEHVEDPVKVLSEMRRVLKRGGYGVFLVPSDSLLFRIIWWFWLHFYPRGWVWRDTHIQTYRNNFLSKLCKKAGFKIEVDKKFNLGMLHVVKVRKI
ncbi:MAG: Methyltransferase type 11 [Candidatus Woesebacteria bacterium GW2011_GWB1_41_10]|uniref:Methyltransferase type 11 n=1 Tax=Candidatus Woesebacteria bacterium GW2011_GWB1_41_10 TaxID=1618577 RepID=A0A0G0XB82_9BACT|nr:MAG: Methyltransferase type 11 [Candidatus Woesebacteria bacterium GW2011_GWB1_41_10]